MESAKAKVHTQVRYWIEQIIEERGALVALAARQRAKFEGWLKFELADKAQREGASEVRVEPVLPGGRADLSFVLAGERHIVELKTPNTNYRIEGVEALTRPITKNIASIVEDAEKLARCGGGVIAFILFPLRPKDRAWENYLLRIGQGIGRSLIVDEHVTRVAIPATNADLAIVTFSVEPR